MQSINNIIFVFYYRQKGDDRWEVSQPVTLGEIIDGNVELSLSDESTLPMNDIDWSADELQAIIISGKK